MERCLPRRNTSGAWVCSAAGNACYFNAATWQNAFKQVSFLDLADASVAFFTDRLIPAVVPGTTSTGRPYIISLADQVNLMDPATTPLNTSDPVVLISRIKVSMHVDREPFTWFQGILYFGVASIFIFSTGPRIIGSLLGLSLVVPMPIRTNRMAINRLLRAGSRTNDWPTNMNVWIRCSWEAGTLYNRRPAVQLSFAPWKCSPLWPNFPPSNQSEALESVQGQILG